jgi:hypothetical protein
MKGFKSPSLPNPCGTSRRPRFSLTIFTSAYFAACSAALIAQYPVSTTPTTGLVGPLLFPPMCQTTINYHLFMTKQIHKSPLPGYTLSFFLSHKSPSKNPLLLFLLLFTHRRNPSPYLVSSLLLSHPPARFIGTAENCRCAPPGINNIS